MPQWDFLTVLAEEAKTLSTFRLLFRHEATDLCRDGRIVVGVNATSPGGDVPVRATLTVAADGRGSIIRNHSDLAVYQFSAPMDVLWFRVSRSAGGREGLDMHIGPGRLMLAVDRGDYWQIAYVVLKGTDKELRAGDIRDLRRAATDLMPALKSRIDEVRSWDEVKTLTVQMDRLQRWHQPGLLCIGDAAHAMSPIGGVGINLAVQDAVAAGRMLGEPLRTGQLTSRTLAAIQRRRQLPTAATQILQRAVQRFVIQATLESSDPITAPTALRILSGLPPLQALPAPVIGMGLRPERLGRGQ